MAEIQIGEFTKLDTAYAFVRVKDFLPLFFPFLFMYPPSTFVLDLKASHMLRVLSIIHYPIFSTSSSLLAPFHHLYMLKHLSCLSTRKQTSKALVSWLPFYILPSWKDYLSFLFSGSSKVWHLLFTPPPEPLFHYHYSVHFSTKIVLLALLWNSTILLSLPLQGLWASLDTTDHSFLLEALSHLCDRLISWLLLLYRVLSFFLKGWYSFLTLYISLCDVIYPSKIIIFYWWFPYLWHRTLSKEYRATRWNSISLARHPLVLPTFVMLSV